MPTSTRLKSNVAISLVKLGDAKLAFKDASGALAAYQESYEIRKRLAEADKTNTRLGWDTATTLEKIADTKKGTGDKAAALAAYAEAIDICRDIGTLVRRLERQCERAHGLREEPRHRTAPGRGRREKRQLSI